MQTGTNQPFPDGPMSMTSTHYLGESSQGDLDHNRGRQQSPPTPGAPSRTGPWCCTAHSRTNQRTRPFSSTPTNTSTTAGQNASLAPCSNAAGRGDRQRQPRDQRLLHHPEPRDHQPAGPDPPDHKPQSGYRTSPPTTAATATTWSWATTWATPSPDRPRQRLDRSRTGATTCWTAVAGTNVAFFTSDLAGQHLRGAPARTA